MSISYLLTKLIKPYETNMIQPVTRQEMVAFLRDRLITFDSVRTRDEILVIPSLGQTKTLDILKKNNLLGHNKEG